MKLNEVIDKVNVIFYGNIYEGIVQSVGHNFLEITIGDSHFAITEDEIIGPCTARVCFMMGDKKKTIECSSPAEAWTFVEKVVTPHGWRLRSVTKGFEY